MSADPTLTVAVPVELLERVARRGAELALAEQRGASRPDPYVEVEEAARYLAREKQRIHDLRAEEALRYAQDGRRLPPRARGRVGWERTKGMSGSVELSPESVEAIARRLAELLRGEQAGTPPRLIDAAELAGLLGVSRGWVYAHAEALGAIRIGHGPRARLRFDADRALAAWACCSSGDGRAQPARSPAAAPKASRRGQRAAGTGAPLVPIRGRQS